VRQRVLMVKLTVYSSGVRGLWNAPRNMIVVRAFIIIMFMYSAIKNRANGPAAYSTLNLIQVRIPLRLGQRGLGLFLLMLR
jgi:hypothetical protein